MEENKRKIAAMTAVLYYLQAEEETTRQEVLAAQHALGPAQEGFWSYSGRQSQMMLRAMAQMRLFPAWRG